jgi:hypothetical protein
MKPALPSRRFLSRAMCCVASPRVSAGTDVEVAAIGREGMVGVDAARRNAAHASRRGHNWWQSLAASARGGTRRLSRGGNWQAVVALYASVHIAGLPGRALLSPALGEQRLSNATGSVRPGGPDESDPDAGRRSHMLARAAPA